MQKLSAYGVNPEYLWNPLVTDWRMAPKSEVDEMSLHNLRVILESVRKERDELVLNVARTNELVEKLREELAKCQEAKK